MRLLNERSVCDGGKFCLQWLVILSNQFDTMPETGFSCDTVGSELWLTILSSLLCPGTEWNILTAKLCVYFN